MRLFRRTLLCLVVGVTAFGAAGWGLRPRASWTVELSSKEDYSSSLVEPLDPRSPSALVWLMSMPDHQRLTAYDAGTGRRLGDLQLKSFDEHPFVRGDGCILAERSTLSGFRLSSTAHRLYSGANGQLIAEHDRRGAWTPTPDGKRLFEYDAGGDSLVVRFASVESDKLDQYSLPISDRKSVVAHSSDGSKWAVAGPERSPGGFWNTAAIEVWDARSGVRLARAALPMRDRSFSLGKGVFENNDERITFKLDMKPWEFIWRTGEARPLSFSGTGPRSDYTTDPPGPRNSAFARRIPGKWDRRAYLALDIEPSTAWLGFESEDYQMHPWKEIPFPLVVRRDHMGFRHGVRATLVPGSSAVLVHASEPPAIEALPVWARGVVPQKWKDWREEQQVCRWCDLTRDLWRYVGCTAIQTQVRPDALIVVGKEGDRTVLQSWPLPPRDPGPYALAIAALCMAGTWWWCAWRYRRRMRRATLGAA